MRVLYDYQAFIYQQWGGITRYFKELITHLPPECEPILGVRVSPNIHAQKLSGVEPYRGVLSDSGGLPRTVLNSRVINKLRLMHLRSLNRPWFFKQLEKNPPDVVHLTLDFEVDWLERLGKIPFVYTVHDCIPERYWNNPAYFKQRKELAQRAARIIAVSENTKADCIDYFKVPEDKVEVIYHAPTLEMPDKTLPPIIKGDYLLYVGTRNRQKNFTWFVETIAPLLNKHPELQLVCTGLPFNRQERVLLKKLKVEKQTSAHFYSESELANLYTYARAFIYPSLYEGFGLPILEAFKAGCPVILPKSSCFPEVAGDAAFYFELGDAEELIVKISSIWQKKTLHKKQIERGLRKVADFSWSRTAIKTVCAYSKINIYSCR